MRILAISDTHGFHDMFTNSDFDNIDMVIHAGDFSNSKIPVLNSVEALNFLEWYNDLPVKYKILISGNHETSIYKKLVDPRVYKNIIYLEHESVCIEGINIFGSPYTPIFHDWAFNVRRDKLHDYWTSIPENTDIVVTHGPPKGMLDLAYNGNILEYCGDVALLKAVVKVNPRFHIFGHIHQNENNYNAGRRTSSLARTEFINASCMLDGKFSRGLNTKGIIILYRKLKMEIL